MNDQDILPSTGSDIPSGDLEGPLQDAQSAAFYHLASCLWSAGSKAEKEGDEAWANAYRTLATVSSLHQTFGDVASPYGPAHHKLTSADILTLQAILPRLTNKALRARSGDLIWLREKSAHQIGRDAIYDFLDAADALVTPDSWIHAPPLYKRALQIANRLGRKNAPYGDASERLLTALENPIAQTEGNYVSHLLYVVFRAGVGEPGKLADIAAQQATLAAASKDHERRRNYLEHEAAFSAALEDSTRASDARLNAARTYIDQAEQCLERTPPSYMASVHFLAQGVEALRQAGENQDAVKELRHRLSDYQKLSLREMKTIQMPVSPELESQARKPQRLRQRLSRTKIFEKRSSDWHSPRRRSMSRISRDQCGSWRRPIH